MAAALNNPAAAGPAASSGGLEPRLKRLVRPVRGVPRPDSTFLDITPLLADGAAFSQTIRALADRYRSAGLAAIAGVEARGLFFAPAVAAELGVGFLPIRKPEQLPGPTHRSSVVQMDYGERQLELHSGLLPRSSHPGTAGHRVAVIDDVLATGGSLLAFFEVLRQLGVAVVEAACVYDLHLGGKAVLAEVGVPAFCLANFREDGNREWWLERGTEEEAAATVSPHMGKRLKQAVKP